MNILQHPNSAQNHEFLITDDIPPLVEPRAYEVMLDFYETALMFKTPKLILTFTIVTQGPAYGIRLPRYYNVKRLIGKPGKNGNFAVGKKGDFLREFLTLFSCKPDRLDRLPISYFNGVTIKARVVTVKRSRNRDIPEALQYSKISELLRVVG